jgi:hypothetical protein
MIVKIKRFGNTKNTPGHLAVYKDDWTEVWSCKSLELPWNNNIKQKSCIPTGTYKVVPRTSVKFSNHFHVLNVPNRDLILVHNGNFSSINPEAPSHILGCILVGLKHTDLNGDGYIDIANSKLAMKKLLALCPLGFTLIIE